MRYKVNMRSHADTVEGHGVLSAYQEQVHLVKQMLAEHFEVYENVRLMRADITHIHTVNLSYFFSLPFYRMTGTTVGYVHFLPETVEESLRMPKLFKAVFYRYLIRFYKSIEHLVVVNPYFIDRLEAYGVKRSNITYIPNFVSEEKFHQVPEHLRALYFKKYQLDPKRFTVLSVGQLQRRKGIFDLLEIAKQMPEIQFVWAGGLSFGTMTDGYRQIKQVLDNPPENIRFLGIVPREQMNELYNLADVMFLPSFEELFPMAVLEAMNCKVPILLRDVDIYKNILFDYYQKGKNVQEFIEQLHRLRTDPDYYAKAAQDAWRGHEFYSREHVASMWDDFYMGILKPKSLKRADKKGTDV